jgi:ribosomal-protein-alanine N-acetyltransferase
VIRPATGDDVDAVARLEEVCLGADAWSTALLADGITGGLPTVRYLVEEQDGLVVGYAVTSIVADVAELQRIAVDPDRRRAGTGTRLLRAVVSEAGSGGAERLLLEVRETNTGALGF